MSGSTAVLLCLPALHHACAAHAQTWRPRMRLACRLTDSVVKQPARGGLVRFAPHNRTAGLPALRHACAIARVLDAGPGQALVEFPILPSLEGSGAPADAGILRNPRWMAGETIRWDALRRRPLVPVGTRRLPALHSGVLTTGRAALSVRGPATPVSQLLAPGRNARERSPAIARVHRDTFPRSPRRRISRRRGFPAWPTR